MDLSDHRREGFKVVEPIDRHPRQPVAAMDMTGRASVQRPLERRFATNSPQTKTDRIGQSRIPAGFRGLLFVAKILKSARCTGKIYL
jgi:hypothetical protein